MHHCLTGFKTSIAVLQKCQQVQPPITDDSKNIMILSSLARSAISIIDDHNVLVECCNAAAMVLLSVLLHFPRLGMEQLVEAFQQQAEFGRHLKENVSNNHSSDDNSNTNSSVIVDLINNFLIKLLNSKTSYPSSVIVVLHAILVKIPSDVIHKQHNGSDNSFFLTFLLDKLILISTESKDKNTMVLTFKTLASWVTECSSIVLKDASGILRGTYIEVLIRKVLPHLVVYIDHTIDTIRHSVTAAVKECFLTLSRTSNHEEIDAFCGNYFRSDLKSRGKLSILTKLCEFIEIEKILAVRPCLPSQLLELLSDVDLVPHACNLYKVASEKHLQDLEKSGKDDSSTKWKDTWLDCLQFGLSSREHENQANIANHIVPALIKVNPSVTKCLLDQLKNGVDDDNTSFIKFRMAVVFLKSARAMKSNVKLDCLDFSTALNGENKLNSNSEKNEKFLWKGLLSMAHLKRCLTDIDEQVSTKYKNSTGVSAVLRVSWKKARRSVVIGKIQQQIHCCHSPPRLLLSSNITFSVFMRKEQNLLAIN